MGALRQASHHGPAGRRQTAGRRAARPTGWWPSLRLFARDRKGGTALEYGLISAILATSIIGAVSLLGNGVDGMWDRMTTSLNAPLGGGDAGDGEGDAQGDAN